MLIPAKKYKKSQANKCTSKLAPRDFKKISSPKNPSLGKVSRTSVCCHVFDENYDTWRSIQNSNSLPYYIE